MTPLACLLVLGLTTANEPPTTHGKATKTHGVAVPQEETAKAKTGHGEEKPAKATHGTEKAPKAKFKVVEEEPEEEPKPAPRPVIRRKPAPPKPVVPKAAAIPAPTPAEMRAAQLTEENARLQQELARRQGLSLREPTSPDEALAELMSGNERFVGGHRVRTLLSMQDMELREKLATGQAPFAIVVTCADSRLADNLIFDQELGRLFTIREAGNSPDTQGLASAEYAVEHLGSKIIVILGHTACGAVKAVKEAHGTPLPGNLWSLQAAMAGLLESVHADPNESGPGYVNRLAAENAKRQAKVMLDRSEIIRKKVEGRTVKIVPALYDLASGKVSFFTPVTPSAAPAEAHH